MPPDGSGNAKVERRLAAVLAADIAGSYTKLAEDAAHLFDGLRKAGLPEK